MPIVLVMSVGAIVLVMSVGAIVLVMSVVPVSMPILAIVVLVRRPTARARALQTGQNCLRRDHLRGTLAIYHCIAIYLKNIGICGEAL
jgi:hypothetical protein